MTFSFLLRLSLRSCEFPNSLFHTSGQEPRWRGGGLRWTQMDQKKGHACPFLSYIDSSPHFWMALGHPGLCHWCFFFFFFSLTLLPVILFALVFLFHPWLCSLFLPLISSFSFLQVTQVHVERDLQDGKGEGWGGWSCSNSAGDQCQAQVLGPWWRLSGKKSEMQKRIKNKKGNLG